WIVARIVIVRDADEVSASRGEGEPQVGVEPDGSLARGGRIVVEGDLRPLRVEEPEVGTQPAGTVLRCVDIEIDDLAGGDGEAVQIDVNVGVDVVADGDNGRRKGERSGLQKRIVQIIGQRL